MFLNRRVDLILESIVGNFRTDQVDREPFVLSKGDIFSISSRRTAAGEKKCCSSSSEKWGNAFFHKSDSFLFQIKVVLLYHEIVKNV